MVGDILRTSVTHSFSDTGEHKYCAPPLPPSLEKQPDEDDPGRGTLMRCASFVGMGILLYVVLQFFARLAVAVYETISQLMAVGLYNWGIFTFGITACAFGIGRRVVVAGVGGVGVCHAAGKWLLFGCR